MARISHVALGLALASGILLAAQPRAHAADANALAEQVQIRRTAYGVPHIKGESLAAVAFGFGKLS